MTALSIMHHVGPTDLACAFPPKKFLNGAMTTIADLNHHGLTRANRLFVPSKAAAVSLIVATGYLRGCARGKGNRAKRRQNL